MKCRNLAVISIVSVMGIAAALIWLSAGLPARAFVANAPDALQYIPSDYSFVFGMNVQRLATSPFYLKLRQEQPQAAQIGSELSQFAEQTGIDPAQDISYLVAAGRAGASPKAEGLLIASGNFDKNRVASFVRSKAAVTDMEYAGTSIMMIPDKKDNGAMNGMAFLSERDIAMGDLASIKAALDTRAGEKKSILSNAAISSLLASINLDEMFWFAGDVASAIRNSPLPVPPALNTSSIQSIAGTFDIGESIAGRITATTIDATSATKLADVFRGIVALGQLSGEQNSDLKTLLNAITLTQNAAQISLSFNIPGELAKKLGKTKSLPAGAI